MTTGKQSPLGINALSSLVQNIGLTINPVAAKYMGSSTDPLNYTLGRVCQDTCLRMLTHAIRAGYDTLDDITHNNLLTLGHPICPALGNSVPTTYWPTYTRAGGAPVQWGHVRLFALQAYNEFDYNHSLPVYQDFLSSFSQAHGFIENSNAAILSADNAKSFMAGVFSNMSDYITSDVSGVSSNPQLFGQDLLISGKAIDLSTISSFGMPSNIIVSLRKANALTQPITLALLTAGCTNTEIDQLYYDDNFIATLNLQTKILNALQLIIGQDLRDSLIQLNCGTAGITSLADLLDLKKLFPNSYRTLTVPVYNLDVTAKSCKTYHKIYNGSGVNSHLLSSEISEQIGTITLPGKPEIVLSTAALQKLPMGLGSYLYNVGLDDDVAVAAGAFSMAMQQIYKISEVSVEKFAFVAANLETTDGLEDESTGPVDSSLVDAASAMLKLGSGPQGTYTMSNFFGCMSGLPYDWDSIYKTIKNIESTLLYQLYTQLFLAADAQPATTTAITETRSVAGSGPGLYDWEYRITGFRNTWGIGCTRGGGYARLGNTIAPTVSVTSPTASGSFPGPNPTGATVTTTIDTNSIGAGGVANPDTYGRVTSFVFGGSNGSWIPWIVGATTNTPPTEIDSLVTVTVQWPPTGAPNFSLPYPYGSGTNTNTPANMNPVVQMYLDAANQEIAAIAGRYPSEVKELNNIWDSTGTQLAIEQRAIATAYDLSVPLSGDDLPRQGYVSQAPSVHYSFVDSIPEYAKNTKPHMYAQTLEAIADLTTSGGRSLVMMMRQARNKARLQMIGIAPEDSIESELTPADTATLIANGTLPTAVPLASPDGKNTAPAYFKQLTASSEIISPTSSGYYDKASGDFIINVPGECVPPGTAAPTGAAIEPGSFASNPNRRLIPPELNAKYGSNTLLPSTPAV